MYKNLFIPYYRVSREEQGKSGLGLASQQSYIRAFVKKHGTLVCEYQDVETGKNDERSKFNDAIKACQEHGAILIVYDIDRLARASYSMMAKLEASGIEYISAIAPHDSKFSKSIKFVVAKEEVERISRNTKKALQVIKDKIANGEEHISKNGNVVTRLGSPVPISREAIENSARIRTNMAINNPDNRKAGAFIITLRDDGRKSFYAITKILNESGFETSKGNKFSEVQTKRLYNRYKK